MSELPPLYVGIVDLVRELWPNATWTESLRQQWRERLARSSIDTVMKAIREHHANSRGKDPCLAEVLKQIRISEPAEMHACRIDEEEKRKVDEDRRQARITLQQMAPDLRNRYRKKLEDMVQKKIPEELEKWTPTQCSLILAIATNDS